MIYSLKTKKTFHSCLIGTTFGTFHEMGISRSCVYSKQKHSVSPGPRAREVDAAARGETYSYTVDKFWIIKQHLEDGQLLLITRTGKQHAMTQMIQISGKRPSGKSGITADDTVKSNSSFE